MRPGSASRWASSVGGAGPAAASELGPGPERGQRADQLARL